ncbi:hypothetical protein RirG_011870 [Rhizophagus irregularis DAOM 197198w]|uniref:Uncharacterized protein n=1 Tax=Rhizophagus irregularis (strain DAOM 197198w) TaxID=1432141 RepID=A0A015NHA5_RHIIW|nr:hypothetical protein RirG_011870 [Rhizophagus irregularis DAOM 197198w]
MGEKNTPKSVLFDTTVRCIYLPLSDLDFLSGMSGIVWAPRPPYCSQALELEEEQSLHFTTRSLVTSFPPPKNLPILMPNMGQWAASAKLKN